MRQTSNCREAAAQSSTGTEAILQCDVYIGNSRATVPAHDLYPATAGFLHGRNGQLSLVTVPGQIGAQLTDHESQCVPDRGAEAKG